MSNPEINLADAERFLSILDTEGDVFDFRTFDDVEDRDDPKLLKTFRGTLAEHADRLTRLNKKGAGVFVVINATDGKGLTSENIVRVRAAYVDLDGSPLEPITSLSPNRAPHIVVKSSPGRWHAYWLTNELPLDEFGDVQRALIKKFNGDETIQDLPRVMRLPGFLHRKAEPFLSRIITVNDSPVYPATFFERRPTEKYSATDQELTSTLEKVAAALDIIPNEDADWHFWNNSIGMPIFAATGGSEEGRALFDKWSQKSKKYNARVVQRAWKRYGRCPPTHVGFGRLWYLANEESPGWLAVWDEENREPEPSFEETLEASIAEGKRRADAATHNDTASAPPPPPPKDDPPRKKKDGEKVHPPIKATPLGFVDFTKIPMREWLYSTAYIRSFLSMTVSTGGKGKSSLMMAEGLAMASGKPLLGVLPTERLRVWYWNGEDPRDELLRRTGALVKHHKLETDDYANTFFLDSGRTMPIVLAEQGKGGTYVAVPKAIEQIVETLRQNKIDVLMIDPFVSCHHVTENDNTSIERVAKTWSRIAEEANCSIMIAHHTRKTMNGSGVTVDDGRGASALLAAARVGRTINTMTEKEAEEAGLDVNHRNFYIRADNGKANMTKAAVYADWFKFESIDLGNNPLGPTVEGDDVGVVVEWTYPEVKKSAAVTVADIQRAQDAIKAGGPWRKDQRAKPWVGEPIGAALGRDATDSKAKKYLAGVVEEWLAKGLLVVVSRRAEGVSHRTPVPFVEVGRAPTPADGAEAFTEAPGAAIGGARPPFNRQNGGVQ